MNPSRTLLTLAMIGLLAVPALADWKDGDGHKMHFPQFPDPNGWDIDMTNYVLADDWKCSATGKVSDIHFWYSIKGDIGATPIPRPHIASINVSIHKDIPKGPDGFSIPGTQEWFRTFTQFKTAGPFSGQQGWDDPRPNTISEPMDHRWFWQVNITGIREPFTQHQGEIYWLDLQVVPATGADLLIGWKTSLDHFRDWAVYQTTAAPVGWAQIAVCTDNQLTDLAFVITPEPASAALVLLGLPFALRRRRRRR